MSEETTQPTIIEKAAELAGQEIEMNIEDGAFTIRPADAAIVMLASIDGMEKEIEEAWSAVDELSTTVEDLRNSSAEFRTLLADLAEMLEVEGRTDIANKIYNALYKIVAVDDEGNEVEFIFGQAPAKEEEQ